MLLSHNRTMISPFWGACFAAHYRQLSALFFPKASPATKSIPTKKCKSEEESTHLITLQILLGFPSSMSSLMMSSFPRIYTVLLIINFPLWFILNDYCSAVLCNLITGYVFLQWPACYRKTTLCACVSLILKIMQQKKPTPRCTTRAINGKWQLFDAGKITHWGQISR